MPSIPEAEFVPQRKASPRRGITHLSNVDQTVLQIWKYNGKSMEDISVYFIENLHFSVRGDLILIDVVASIN